MEEDTELTHTMWHCALYIYYLDGTVYGCEDEVVIKKYSQVQAGATAWMRVGGTMWDRKLKTTERKSVGSLCCANMYIWVGYTGTDASRISYGSRIQLGQKNKESARKDGR